MKIIVCVKQVPWTSDVALHSKSYTLLRQDVPGMVNPCDKEALEMALRLREKHGGQVYALSMGPEQAREALNECLAIGADEAVLLTDPLFGGSDTLATSYILAAGVRKLGGADLVICGERALDGDTAQVGPELAAHLGFLQITLAVEVEIKGDILTAKRKKENGMEWLSASMPALITVLQASQNPRMPTVKGVVKARNKQISVWNAQDLALQTGLVGVNGSPTKVRRIFSPFSDHVVSCEYIVEKTPELSAKVLIGKLKENNIL